jgi:hypothetical protein
MKKCPRCDTSFPDEYLVCKYCDSRLFNEAELDGLFNQKEEEYFKEKVFNLDLEKMTAYMKEFIVANYFHRRSFFFSYQFCRQEMKTGKKFRRFFIQPFNISFFIRLPWLFVNILDSLFFHLLYGGYCPQCNCKFKQSFESNVSHNKEECAYNKEFAAILVEIFTGYIFTKEQEFRRRAAEKVKLGLKSAYHDLSSPNKKVETLVDIFTIGLSFCLYFYLFARVAIPFVGRYIDLSPSVEE